MLVWDDVAGGLARLGLGLGLVEPRRAAEIRLSHSDRLLISYPFVFYPELASKCKCSSLALFKLSAALSMALLVRDILSAGALGLAGDVACQKMMLVFS